MHCGQALESPSPCTFPAAGTETAAVEKGRIQQLLAGAPGPCPKSQPSYSPCGVAEPLASFGTGAEAY